MKKYPVLNYAPRHEDVLGSGGISPRIFNLGTRWSASRSGRFTPGKDPSVPIGWVLESMWTLWQREKNPCPCRESKPVVSVITEPTRLYVINYALLKGNIFFSTSHKNG